MNKKLWITVSFFVVALIVVAIVYTFPQKYTFTIEGVSYQLGEENSDFQTPVTISVNGKIIRNILGTRTFTGSIDIEGENVPVPEDQRELELKLGKHGDAILTYVYILNSQLRMYSYGGIFINNDFSKFTIFKYEREEDSNQSKGSWNAENGYMISAPAQNRQEALDISNELMNDDWQGYILK